MGGIPGLFNVGQLSSLANEKGIIEVAIRNKQKRFVEFQKFVLQDSQGEAQQMLQKVLNAINKRGNVADKAVKMLNNVAKLQQLSLIMNGLNLCATCAGFAIMYAKLDKISKKMDQIVDLMKKQNGVQVNYEFKKVLSEHSNMLDSRKTQKYYTEEQMRKLVDDEFNVLNLLLDSFEKDLSADQEDLIVSIFSLAAMLTVSLRYFDELYYFNNIEAIGDGDPWHSSHDTWMTVYSRIQNPELVKKIQDHALFDLMLSTKEIDTYYMALLDQVRDYAEEVTDNQILIKTINDKELVAEMRKAMAEDIRNDIEASINSVEGVNDEKQNQEVREACEKAMRQMAVAA